MNSCFITSGPVFKGAQWLLGRVLHLRSRDHFSILTRGTVLCPLARLSALFLVLVQPWKVPSPACTCPYSASFVMPNGDPRDKIFISQTHTHDRLVNVQDLLKKSGHFACFKYIHGPDIKIKLNDMGLNYLVNTYGLSVSFLYLT